MPGASSNENYISQLNFREQLFKPFSLMIRLYANMFAGHVVLMSIIGLMFTLKVGLEVHYHLFYFVFQY
jgi:F-type H+-transporting ATPase subunit a